MKKETKIMNKLQKTFKKKNWQSIASVLIVGLFVCSAAIFNSADLSLKDVVFGYGGGTSPAVSASYSTVEASPISVDADGTSVSTITVTVKNTSGSAMSGKTVAVSSSRGTTTDTIATITGTTSSDGKATFSIKSSTAGDAVISATASGTAITDTATVTFTAVGETTTTTELSEGAVARIGTASEVYVIKIVGDNKYKRHIVSSDVFNSYGHLSWGAIQSASSLDGYSLSAWVRVCTGANGTAAAADKVYEINADSTMHWLNMTAAQFFARGGSEEAIYNVNAGELGLYTQGADVMYQ